MSLAVTEKFSLIGVIFQRRCNHEGGCIEKWTKHTKKEELVGDIGWLHKLPKTFLEGIFKR